MDDAHELELTDSYARQQALQVDRSVLCAAPAGSGKTELLVQRALACLAASRNPEETLMITFTNKAAQEIRERVMRALSGAVGPKPAAEHACTTWHLAREALRRDEEFGWGLRLNPGRLRAMTIDALNAMLAGMAPVLSGMGGALQVADRPEPIYRDAVMSLFAELDELEDADTFRVALGAVLRFGRNRSEELVPLLSQMLAKREQWLPLVARGEVTGIKPVLEAIILSRLDAVSRSIPLRLQGRIAAAAAAAGRCAGTAWPDNTVAALSEWQRLCGLLVTKQGDLRKRLQAPDGFPPKAAHTEEMKACLLELQALADPAGLAGALTDVAELPAPDDTAGAVAFADQVRAVLFRLAGHLKLAFMRAGAVDFAEVARRALDALSDDQGATPLLQRLDYQVRHILIDESQDTSSAQMDLLAALTSGWQPGDGRSLFIVGDKQQSIYGFRQADVAGFLALERNGGFNGIPLERLQLTRNFRSDPAVVGWCNDTFRRIFPTLDDAYTGSVRFSASVAARAAGGGAVQTHWFRGEPHQEEAAAAVRAIKEALTHNPTGSIAVLARYRSHVRETLAALTAAGLGYSCKDIDPLASTPAVGDMVGLIRALWHEQDRVAWATLFRAPFVGLSYADLLAVTKGSTTGSLLQALRARRGWAEISADGRCRIGRFLDVLDRAVSERDLAQDLGRLAQAVWYELGGPACVTAGEAEDVRATLGLLREHLVGGRPASMREFMDALQHLYAAPDGGGPVQVMTMHAAKGLEFDTVILVGLWRGQRRPEPPLLACRETPQGTLIVPAPRPRAGEGHQRLFRLANRLNRDAERRELLRLLYVACTRARDRLHLMCAVSGTDREAPLAGSSLELMWPALSADYIAAGAAPASGPRLDSDLRCPVTPRLRVGWTYPAPQNSYVAPRSRVLLPAELAVREAGAGGEDRREHIYERLVGIGYHETMARLLDRGELDQLPRIRESLRSSLIARMRMRGMPEPRVMAAATRVLDLVDRTLASRDGRWLAARRAVSGNEIAVAGYLDGEWVAGVVDRFFVEPDALWVIDYKSGGEGLTGSDLDRYVEAERRRYAPQVAAYARLMSELHRLPVKAAFYFPEAGRIVPADVPCPTSSEVQSAKPVEA